MAIYVVLNLTGNPECYFEAESPQKIAEYLGAEYSPEEDALYFPPALFKQEGQRRIFRKGSLEIPTAFPNSGVTLKIRCIEPIKIPKDLTIF